MNLPLPSRISLAFLLACVLPLPVALAQKSQDSLRRLIEESLTATRYGRYSKGSLYNDQSYLSELGRDPKAAVVGDLVTIRVAEQASALTTGASSSTRTSEADHSIGSLFGVLNPAGTLANLARSTGESTLDGEGATSRRTSVTATITAYVTHVMPNGNLVIEGIKEILVNSERQVVWLRGMARQVDLLPDNSVRSDRIAMMELRINGKGVVNDAIRRPNLLMRIFNKVMPF